ncbi:hypothetical protein FHS85_002466 [Rhodoligotrophos appendicifer]
MELPARGPRNSLTQFPRSFVSLPKTPERLEDNASILREDHRCKKVSLYWGKAPSKRISGSMYPANGRTRPQHRKAADGERIESLSQARPIDLDPCGSALDRNPDRVFQKLFPTRCCNPSIKHSHGLSRKRSVAVDRRLPAIGLGGFRSARALPQDADAKVRAALSPLPVGLRSISASDMRLKAS